MAPFTQWIRSFGGSGAVENAARACAQRRSDEAAVEARLAQLVAAHTRSQVPEAAGGRAA